MFGTIANSYDRMNGILSLQLHRLWNRKLMRETLKGLPGTNFTFADLCCGTGAITLPWLATNAHQQSAHLIDFCREMLKVAEQKAKAANLTASHRIEYIKADVQSLPLPSNFLDFATIAYGIRNVKTPLLCFEEVFRTLKPNGTFGILELTKPKSLFLNFGHSIYLKTLLPLLGKLFSNNAEAYRYLSQSIQTFVEPVELQLLLTNVGFRSIRLIPLFGGISTLLIAQK